MLAIVEYLNNNSLESIEEKYAIKYRRHSDFPNLILFKYNMIDSPMNAEVVKDARGIILDENNNWTPISMAYRKFFNYGEYNADEIDWNSAKVLEKLDGSIISLYYYKDAWRVSTSGTPDARVNVGDNDFTFEDLFWETFKDLDYVLPTDTNIVYTFELMSKWNRIVVSQDESRLVLHGARNMSTLEEFNWDKLWEVANEFQWRVVGAYEIDSLDTIITASLELNPMKQEGYVVVDDSFNRIKVKSPQYVALHHMVDKFSKKYMMQIILTNECDEFLTYFPEHKDLYYETKAKFDKLINDLNNTYAKYQHLSPKFFGLATKDELMQGALFMIKNGKVKSIEEYFKKQIELKGIKTVAKRILENLK